MHEGRKYHPGKGKEQIQDTSTRHTAKITGKPQQKQSKTNNRSKNKAKANSSRNKNKAKAKQKPTATVAKNSSYVV